MGNDSGSRGRRRNHRDRSGSSPRRHATVQPLAPIHVSEASLRDAVAASKDRAVVVVLAGMTDTAKRSASATIIDESGRSVDMIDLSQVVSKYIGETEKNLISVFSEASKSGWVLFFDEADALFGKRTAVEDAHDRYANVEVSYLADLAEEHGVTAIVALNDTDGVEAVESTNLLIVVGAPD